MAEEEKQEQEQTTEPEAAAEAEAPEAAAEQDEPEAGDEASAEEAPAEEVPAGEEVTEEEPAEEEAPEEEPAAEEPAAEEEPPATEPAPEAEAPPPQHPKQIRKLERSRASGPPGPQRSPEDRASQRAERRRSAQESRRRHRAARRRKRGEPGTGTPPAEREPGPKKVRQGTVVSAGADKTITVEIAVVRRHATYEKVVRRTSRLRAHDESNQAQEGDVVRVIEARPLSRTKRWRLLDVVEKAR
jgi:small subunit ribosomal protein S17